MRLIVRLLLVVVSASTVLALSVVGLSVVGHLVVHNTASATELPLPPLTDRPLGGSTIYAADGTVLAVEQASKLRLPVPLSSVPKVLVSAVLDTEDASFYIHGGFDVRSALRAAAHDSSGGGLQGGSDITQQVVKNIYLTPSQTLSRKIREAVLAERLQQKYTKNQILAEYLNTVYLGSGAYGVQAAAKVFFNKDVSQLTLPEAALLAGNIQNPSGYDPISNPTGARVRRSEVLGRMVTEHSITKAQAAQANLAPLPSSLVPAPNPVVASPDYDYVQQVVDQLLGSNSPLGKTYQQRYAALYEGGLKIYTNLEPSLQAAAVAAVNNDTPANSLGLEEAQVAIEPATGKVKTLVGGNTSFDIVTQGGLQPGSGFKIFTLLPALEMGYSINSMVNATAPCAISFPPSATGTAEGNYSLLTTPIENDEGPGSGGVTTIANATAQSYNCAFIRIAHEIKLTTVISMARQLGVTAQLNAYPSMVLGAAAVEPLQMAAAYAAVADGGVYHAPTFIDHITNRTGLLIYDGSSPGRRVVPAAIAAEATVAFRDVVTGGTGTAAAVYGHQVAGKTGTSNGPIAAWFNGFTPQLASTVWMGNPVKSVNMFLRGSPVYGGTYPARTFHDFMTSALSGLPAVNLVTLTGAQVPSGKPVTSAGLTRDDHSIHGVELPTTTTTTRRTPAAPTSSPTTVAPGAVTPTTVTPTTVPPTTVPPAG